MEEALRSKLLATAALAAIVDRRIDWGLRAQGSPLPGIALHLVSSVPQMTFAGSSGWTRARVQIDSWGRTFKVARDLGDIIGGHAGILTGFRGDLSGLRVRTFIMGARSFEDSDGSSPVHCRSTDVLVWHAALSNGANP